MRSWPIRIKLLVLPAVSAALAAGLTVALAGGGPDHRGSMGFGVIAAFLAFAAAALCLGARLVRRIDELGEVLAQLQDGGCRRVCATPSPSAGSARRARAAPRIF